MNDITLLLTNFFGLFMESAPWLLMGLLVAGIMHELVPVSLLQKHMGKNSVGAVIKSAFIGAPLPLCSCGVIPAALGLRRSGASKPATASFLVSTPETGVDSISVSYALLGPVFAVVRPVAAIFSAIYTGLMVKWFVKDEQDISSSSAAPKKVKQDSCCSSKAPVQEPVSSCCAAKAEVVAPVKSCCSSEKPAALNTGKPAAQSSCCDTKVTTPAPAETSSCCSSTQAESEKENKVFQIWQFATGKLLEDITMWLLIGLTLAAAIQTWVPVSFLTQWSYDFLY